MSAAPLVAAHSAVDGVRGGAGQGEQVVQRPQPSSRQEVLQPGRGQWRLRGRFRGTHSDLHTVEG